MKLQSGKVLQVCPPSLQARFTGTTERSRKPQGAFLISKPVRLTLLIKVTDSPAGTRTSPRLVQGKATIAEEAPTISQQLLDARKIAVDLFASIEAQGQSAHKMPFSAAILLRSYVCLTSANMQHCRLHCLPFAVRPALIALHALKVF